ncbi:transcriptional regulator [Leptospira gomenensis]|uniref:Transcriptional regulator n=1 Tax=Leptospira gomenensis TaxID=2484974 RepID=A0A5F1YPX4_9LEPT|nr:FecR family protein [Leptospira gomenensis]TGK27955.1 transcriptional regulator [Leptospira gomenensis]TGK37190.1 transcriptional regulator [Leptospira gomenensis]TGK45826.1 transcriptional regulator [Leptospira gomenensis]TGK59765.1 transcriptional regulator [Leptospira gomenensis]
MRRNFFICLTFIVLTSNSCRFISSFLNQENQTPPGVVVIFQNGEIEILREDKKIQSKPGLVLKQNDVITTRSGSLDVQTSSGDVVRIKSFSKVTIKSILTGAKPDVNLYTQAGSLLIKTNKLKSESSFSISTPTAVAGVRGTTFAFELTDGQPPKVKVYEGAVAISFRIPKEIIENSKAMDKELYKEFVTFLESNEVVLENGEESYVKPSLDEMIQLVITRIEENKDISKEFETLKKAEKEDFGKRNFENTPQEDAELETLVAANNDLVKQAVDKNGSENLKAGETSDISSEIEKDHSSKLDLALDRIESNAEANELKSETKIREYYNVLEIIVQSDGKKMSGAIVTQIGDKLIVHTPSGVVRLNKKDVEYVDYQTFEIKTKAK